jgi:acetyltransferase
MKKFFDPQTAALIGASATPFRPGNQLHQNLEITHGDNYYPVNPKQEKIGDKTCYPSIAQVPAPIELAIVFIPAAGVPAALEQCADQGVKRVIIESGGFAETGPEGVALQQRCLDIGRAAGMRLWGPNCMGSINVTRAKVHSFLMPMMWQGKFLPGEVSLVVQSGMLSAGFLLHILSRTPFGLAKISSIGNKMDVDEVDLLEYLIDDPDTGVIAMYLESMKRGRRFCELARQTDKPVVVLKGGRTELGSQAASSHTAALAQDDAILDGALRQAGIIRVKGMAELMDVARCLGSGSLKKARGARVAVLNFSGGAGVVTSDDIHDAGLQLADFAPETLARIKAVFPEWMDPSNPVDLYPAIEKNGPGRTVKVSLEAVMADPQVDAVYIHLFAPPIKVALFDFDHMAQLIKDRQKPLVAWIMGHADSHGALALDLAQRGIPVVDELARGVRVLKALTLRR